MRRITLCILSFTLLGAPARAETPERIFERVSPSVVVVEVSDAASKPVGQGSGVVIGPGAVITNCHVAEDGARLRVTHLGKTFAATLQYADTDRDLCQLSVPKLSAPSVALGDAKGLKVGQSVYAVGAPERLELTLSAGLISALRSVAGLRYIQTTASISPGSSGGGLFDDQGRLIGITTFYVSEGQNLNFALPVDWISGLPERAKANTQTTATEGSNWLWRVAVLEDKADWEELRRLSLQWVKAEPGVAVAWVTLGEAYGNLQQYDKALEAEQEAVRLDPKSPSAWTNLGVAYAELHQYDKALEAEQEAVRLDPQDALAWTNLGADYSGLHQYDKALEADQEAVRLDPKSVLAWTNLGVDYVKLQQYDKAMEAGQEAVRLDPKDVLAWKNLGLDYCLLDRRDKAIEVYEQLRKLDADKAEELFKACIVP